MDDLVRWLREQLASDVKDAYRMGTYLSSQDLPSDLGVSSVQAGQHARFMVQKAELAQAFFEETVVPYLGLEGTTGRLAERQARMMAAMYANRHGYREEWRP